jgi:exoribonuclease R
MLATKDYQRFAIQGTDITFEGARLATRALPGDIVQWDPITASCLLLKRRPGRLLLVGVLELAAKVRYGMTSRGAPMYRFTPYDESYPPFFVGCSAKDTTVNQLARIEFDGWPVTSTCPRGILVQTFGAAGDLKAEEAALLMHWSDGLRWRPSDLAAGVHRPEELDELPFLEEGVTFHIDPPGCRDVDDAITLIQRGAGCVEIQIHIADVASWLVANPELRRIAATMGQTLYRDGAAVRPMFPVEFSEGHFSLLPGTPRAVWSLALVWDPRQGGAGLAAGGAPRWIHQRIQVKASYTYDSAYEAPWAPVLQAITSDIAGRLVTDSHEWVEQLMLFYNREAAKVLRMEGAGVLRRHAGPDLDRLAKLESIGLPANRLAQRAGEYCVAGVAGPTEHWGLGLSAYCHASSPIRRFADCINQLVLAKQLGPLGEFRMEDAVDHLNLCGKRAKSFERDLAFARALIRPEADREVDAIVAEEGRLWVPAWDRLVRAGTDGLVPGQRVRVSVYCDATQRNWKRRLVLRLTALEN